MWRCGGPPLGCVCVVRLIVFYLSIREVQISISLFLSRYLFLSNHNVYMYSAPSFVPLAFFHVRLGPLSPFP